MRCEAPLCGLSFGDDETLPKWLLAEGAADRTGPVAALHGGHPERHVVQIRAPQPLVGWNREVKAIAVHLIGCRCVRPRAPGRHIRRRPYCLVQVIPEALADLARADLHGITPSDCG